MQYEARGARREGFLPRALGARLVLFFLFPLVLLAACAPAQEAEQIDDTEPDRAVNTDLTYPKNPQVWAYVSSKVSTDMRDQFAGFRVVVANPFAARSSNHDRTGERGIKYAQYVYDASVQPGGVVPGALRRVNLLVRDADRYGETGGWGYASFDGTGKQIPISARTDCMNCHTSGPISPLTPPRR